MRLRHLAAAVLLAGLTFTTQGAYAQGSAARGLAKVVELIRGGETAERGLIEASKVMRTPCATGSCLLPLGRSLEEASIVAGLETGYALTPTVRNGLQQTRTLESIPINLSPSDAFQYNLNLAFDALGIGPEEARSLTIPDRIIKAEIPVVIGGENQVLRLVRVQHDNTLGIYKGGIRYHPETIVLEPEVPGAPKGANWDTSEVEALGMGMTYKTAGLGEELGGGKGGVQIPIDETTGRMIKLSEQDLANIDEAVGRTLAPYIGPEVDVPAPDAFTNGTNMKNMAQAYRDATGDPNWLAAFTGKPLDFGGSQGRTAATGFGGAIATERQLQSIGETLEGKKVAVFGFGNVGSYYGEIVEAAGARVIAAGDASGALYNPNGLNAGALRRYVDANRTIAGFEETAEGQGAIKITNEELMALEDSDILATAALGARRTETGLWTADVNVQNAPTIKAKLLVQLDNGGVTPAAEFTLESNGTTVLPDIHSNALGVSISGLEREQNLLGEAWTEERVNEIAAERMVDAGAEIRRIAQQYGVNLRVATLIRGIERIRAERLARGLGLKTATEEIFIAADGTVTTRMVTQPLKTGGTLNDAIENAARDAVGGVH